MKPKDVIKIVFLNQSMNSSTSRGNHSASDVTGNKLPYYLWWMLVRFVIKLQPILETAAAKRCKELQNMNFCSKPKNLLHAYTFLITDSHSQGDQIETQEVIACALIPGQRLLWSTQLENWALLMQSVIYIAILQGEGTTSCDAPHMLYLVTCSVDSTFIQENLPNVTFHTRKGRFWGKKLFLSLNNN